MIDKKNKHNSIGRNVDMEAEHVIAAEHAPNNDIKDFK